MNVITRSAHRLLLTAAAAVVLLTNTAAAAEGLTDGSTESKVVRSANGPAAQRADARMRDRATFVESEVRTVERYQRTGKSDSTTASAVLEEAWIYDADVELFDDYDADGYYTYLRIWFDADSIYADHYVYARLFLTLDGVNWDEYHITDDFLIEGASAFDEYEVETELVSGFPPGLYDALIELYDADFGHFLGEFGPVQSSAFSLLPLEDIDHDAPVSTVVVTTEHGGGGAADVLTLAALGLLAGLLGRARWQRRQSPKSCSAVV